MLDAVRNKIQSNAACGFVDNPVEDTRKARDFLNSSEVVASPSAKKKTSSHEVGGSDSLVDLFASTTDSSAFLGTPRNLLEHNTVRKCIQCVQFGCHILFRNVSLGRSISFYALSPPFTSCRYPGTSRQGQ